MKSLWLVFAIVAFIGLSLDVFCLNSKQNCSNFFRWTCAHIFWILAAMSFNVLIYLVLGSNDALKFLSAYIVELSLSIDNLFVFMSIFSFFSLSTSDQQRALTYGIFGAIVLRLIFIFVGIALLNKFQWIVYIFSCILLVSGLNMIRASKKNKQSSKMLKFFKISQTEPSSEKPGVFGSKLFLPPFLTCVIVIELVDIIFALDSIPAALAITRKPIIVFSSNIFAIIGLRSLYIFLNHLNTKFYLLRYGIGANLIFIGAKMLIEPFYDIPVKLSVFVIITIITTSIVLSMLRKPSNIITHQ